MSKNIVPKPITINASNVNRIFSRLLKLIAKGKPIPTYGLIPKDWLRKRKKGSKIKSIHIVIVKK